MLINADLFCSAFVDSSYYKYCLRTVEHYLIDRQLREREVNLCVKVRVHVCTKMLNHLPNSFCTLLTTSDTLFDFMFN